MDATELVVPLSILRRPLLSPMQNLVVHLHEDDAGPHLSLAEIDRTMGWSRSCAQQHMRRARRKRIEPDTQPQTPTALLCHKCEQPIEGRFALTTDGPQHDECPEVAE